jgi:hypothetical protein
MLPKTIVGSVVRSRGSEPFVLDVASGRVTLGRYGTPDPLQAQMAPDACRAAESQVRSQTGGRPDVRLGVFACSVCSRFVDVIREAGRWREDRCDRCA